MTQAQPKRKGGIRKRPPADVDDAEDEAAAVLLRCPSLPVCARLPVMSTRTDEDWGFMAYAV